MNTFPVTPASPLAARQADTALEIRRQVKQAGTTLLSTYQALVRLRTANPLGLAASDVDAALGTADAADLMQLAALVKGLINFRQPGTITDSVPAATITLPS